MYLALAIIVLIIAVLVITEQKYKKLETEVLTELGFSNWNIISYFDEYVTGKSRQTLEKYDDINFSRKTKKNLFEQKILLKENLI